MNFFKKYNPAFNGEISPGIKFNFDFFYLSFLIPCPTALPAPVIIILIFFFIFFLKIIYLSTS